MTMLDFIHIETWEVGLLLYPYALWGVLEYPACNDNERPLTSA